ncbi:hypothetical protein TNCV_2597951 [Trichonephila clavipes]|nr:hypothetical protein TNCV_2597951 [Trichonephila clavipes]
MWSMVAQRLTQITPPVAIPDQIWQSVEAVWSAVHQEKIQSLFESMPSIERDGDSGAPNDKTGYRSSTMSSFQTSLDSACNILMAVFVSEGSEKITRHLIAFNIGTETLNLIKAHEIDHGKGLDERLPLAVALSTIQVTVRFSSIPPPPILRENTLGEGLSWTQRVFDCYPDLYGLYICHPLKTSGLGLLRDWSATPLQLIRLMKYDTDLKQNDMSFPFLSSKSSSTPSLNE